MRGKVERGDIAGVRAAAHHIGRAHHHLDASLVQRRRRLDRRREFGDGDAIARSFRDVLFRGVVVARQRHAVGLRQLDQPLAIDEGVALRLFLAVREQLVELGVGHAAGLAAIIGAQLVLVAELALAGRVIHQRQQPHIRAWQHRRSILDHRAGRHLAAQVQEMMGAQHVGLAGLGDGIRQKLGVAVGVAAQGFLTPHPERVRARW